MSFSKFTEAEGQLIREKFAELMAIAEPRCRNEYEVDTIKKAFEFANEAHKDIRRSSGEPYILHPIEVAKIVVKNIGLGYKSICTGLLHDVCEDTEYTTEDVSSLFGEKIASFVDGMNRIKTVLDNEDRKGYTENQAGVEAENIKRILLTLNNDSRIVLIKLADRLHNCRTIETLPGHKKDKVLTETMNIFIPLAHRLGLYEMKSEMENIWLKYKKPEDWAEITERIKGNVAQRQADIDNFIEPISTELNKAGFKFSIKKRIKTPYSIWYKMRTKNVPFDQIYDLYAVRIVFEPKEDNIAQERQNAYMILAMLLSLYRDNYSRRRDWISNPKSTGYEALHCTLMSQAGVWIEVQIRSKRMDEIAEKGIAAHWSYKQNGYSAEKNSEMDRWLEQVQDILLSKDVSSLELLDMLQSSEIVVFTPKGEQKTIISKATALDFAYQIHTDIGHSAIAAKVNMKLVPLSHQLKSGDQVEIITATNAKPKAEWMDFLQTRQAKIKLSEYFKGEKSERIKYSDEDAHAFPIRLALKGVDRMGLLNDITSYLSHTMNINIRKLTLSTNKAIFEGFIEFDMKDRKNLTHILNGLRNINGIQDVERTDI